MDPTGLRGGIYLGSGWGGTCWTRGRMILFFSSIALGSSGTRVPCKGDSYSSAAAARRMPLSLARSAEAIRSRVLKAKWMEWLPHTVRCDWCITRC